ncbi:MAG: hypothetical protein J1F14_04790 [Treponema sp.]|nr:hypothetical protein [Treponema sp.]
MKARYLAVLAAMTAFSAASVMAYDATANIRMSGSIMSADKSNVKDKADLTFLTNSPVNQLDNPGDGIEIDFDAGIAGAHLALWYKTAVNNGADVYEKDDWAAHFRRTYIYFRPVDMLTLQLGYVGDDTFFKERIDQWKVGSPFSIQGRNWTSHPGYINCNDVEGWGFGVTLRPITALVLNAGITPAKKGGFDISDDKKEVYTNPSISFDGDGNALVAPWGVGAKYYWKNFEFQASYRRGISTEANVGDYKNSWSVLRFGAGYSDSNVYAFVQPVFGFDYDPESDRVALTGLCLDLYGEYYLSAWTFMLHLPVTLRFTDASGDVNYMEWVAVAKYNLGSFGNLDDLSPYVKVGSIWDDVNVDNAAYRVWRLDDTFNDYFNMSVAGGVTFSVANAKVDVAVQYTRYSSKYDKEWNVSIPFGVKITF